MNKMFGTDLTGKVVVVTGGGGVLGSYMGKALAQCGAKVAVLDYHRMLPDKAAADICKDGGRAIGVSANVLELESLRKAEVVVREEFGNCDILINGAGGNHPKGTTTKEFLFAEDLKAQEEIVTFF